MKYLNAINKIDSIGSKRLEQLVSFFKSPQKIWEAGEKELRASGLGPKTTQKFILSRKEIDPEREWEKLEKENIKIVTPQEENYPKLLKESFSRPYILYVKSDDNEFDFNSKTFISVVGSRKHTAYGSQVAREISKSLAKAGITVVSGMALGIDTLAHKGALEGGGKTIAVLGNSLDDKNISPGSNLSFSREILESGALVSEYSLETQAGPLTFPARNRIIAGLSSGTLVIEAGEKSGSLITARMSLEFNREVFATPGPIFSPQSQGTNKLIKEGAKMVTSAQDILEELDVEFQENKVEKIPENKQEEILIKILSHEPLHIDKIAKLSKLDNITVASQLSIMEMKGWAKNIGGQNYIIT